MFDVKSKIHNIFFFSYNYSQLFANNQSQYTMQISDDLALLYAELQSKQRKIQTTFVNNVANMTVNAVKQSNKSLELKLKRKDKIIAGLKVSLRKISEDKKILEAKLIANTNVATVIARSDSELEILRKTRAELQAKLTELQAKLIENTNVATVQASDSELEIWKKRCVELKAKNKRKQRKIQQYRLALEDAGGDGYDDDPDEEDGVPSDDSDGAEDIEMEDVETEVSKEALLNDEVTDEDTDPDDSDFELNDKEKSKLAKIEESDEEIATQEESECKDEEN